MSMALRLIYSRDIDKAGLDRQGLVRAEKAGELIRLRRGVYVPSADYLELPWWEQRLVHVDAVLGTGRQDHVLIQQSAAAVWGIPTIGRSLDVFVLARNGTHGRNRLGIRCHSRKLLEPLEQHRGYTTTSRAQTVVDLAAHCPFESAVPAMDHVLRADRRRGLPALDPAHVVALAEQLPIGKLRRVKQVLAFANPLAQSAGESYSRALMYLNHFPEPALQHPIFDSNGVRIAIVDFYWKDFRTVGEFDGSVKYSRNEYLAGRDPSTVLEEEKKREDRIRGTGAIMARWMWDALQPLAPDMPIGLVERLTDAGLPQDRWNTVWNGM